MLFSLFLLLCIIVLSVLLIKLLKLNKNVILCILITILIVIFVYNIKISINAALEGFVLWYKAVLPTTFPFVLICNLLIAYGGIELYSKILGPFLCKPLGLSKNCSFAIVASMLCGYPLGAKYSADLYRQKYIDKKEFSRLLNIASNAGPIFLIGSVSVAMFSNIKASYVLLFSSYISAFIIGILTRKKNISSDLCIKKDQNININFGKAIKDSVFNSLVTTIIIGGFISIFSVIITIIKNSTLITSLFTYIEYILSISEGTLYSIFLGSIEFTNGCSIISKLSTSLNIKLSIVSFLCSFSGLSAIAQVSAFVSDIKFNFKKYILLKFFQGIISFFITYAVLIFFPLTIKASNLNNIFFSPNIIFIILPTIAITLITVLLKAMNKLLFHIF
ncbi:sporulation integral membrane protein YlbJ [Clostridium sp. BJN0001]|uniref:sporulation integral membrane protein YlbJ n=1 Tax=Clostridium sp. BJN0001 TaxID=2930219 RepID=UPI001FD088AC|nr:sporulation integral membrane protein YlbJ [Clostridium sp. BJN0001]